MEGIVALRLAMSSQTRHRKRRPRKQSQTTGTASIPKTSPRRRVEGHGQQSKKANHEMGGKTLQVVHPMRGYYSEHVKKNLLQFNTTNELARDWAKDRHSSEHHVQTWSMSI